MKQKSRCLKTLLLLLYLIFLRGSMKYLWIFECKCEQACRRPLTQFLVVLSAVHSGQCEHHNHTHPSGRRQSGLKRWTSDGAGRCHMTHCAALRLYHDPNWPKKNDTVWFGTAQVGLWPGVPRVLPCSELKTSWTHLISRSLRTCWTHFSAV